MKAKLLRKAGKIAKGTEVDIASRAGTKDPDTDPAGASTSAPVYEVTDDEANREEVDTRDLKPMP